VPVTVSNGWVLCHVPLPPILLFRYTRIVLLYIELFLFCQELFFLHCVTLFMYREPKCNTNGGEKLTTGKRIREIREKREMTQEQLAKKAGMSKGFLSDVENDKTNIGSQGILRLANELGASVDYLLAGKVTESAENEQIIIPQELSLAAEELNLSYSDTLDLLNTFNSAVARRGKKYHKELTVDGWKKFHEAIKEAFK
jgi:transcriptional regulator with XRE-family HTH domain